MAVTASGATASRVLIVPLWNWNFYRWLTCKQKALVLIVPLWNWNLSVYDDKARFPCFNRTFMELKCHLVHPVRLVTKSFNRTFMELKLVCSDSATLIRFVLIVPLWNWNYRVRWRLWNVCSVLIVPLWNWNEEWATFYTVGALVLIVPLWNWNRPRRRGRTAGRVSFNRTFMELKSR